MFSAREGFAAVASPFGGCSEKVTDREGAKSRILSATRQSWLESRL